MQPQIPRASPTLRIGPIGDFVAGAWGVLGGMSQHAAELAGAIARRRPAGAGPRKAASEAGAAAFDVEIEEVIVETPSSRTLVLCPVENGKAVSFRAGQYLQVAVTIDGRAHSRTYSISGAQDGGLQITVKAVDDGHVSGYLCRELEAGDRLTVRGPAGRFVLPADDPDAALCFLAVGSGITPIFSMITTALTEDPARRIRLVYGNRNTRETIFGQQLRELSARHTGLEVVEVHSRPAADWTGQVGRLTATRAVDLLDPAVTDRLFLCGPPELMALTQDALQDRGIASERVHSESFQRKSTVAAAPALAQESAAPRVVWKRSEIADTQRPGETLLAASQRVDADVSYICESGECGTCKVRVLSGETIHEPDSCLTTEEAEAGFVLACSSYAVDDVTLDT